jgi:hypothetical protein
LGLQLVNEAALCVTGVRQARSLTQRGFEAACGLPFVATDQAIHELLAQQTIGQTQGLQVALGRIRQASGHFQGRGVYERIARIPPQQWTPQWAGYATLSRPYTFSNGQNPLHQLLQRQGEPPADCSFKAFIATSQRNELDALTRDYPARWHIEEFFNRNQKLGWQRAGTQNLNIRYAQMTAALMAQAAIHQLHQRLGAPCRDWEAAHLARNLFAGLDGDLRVDHDTIVVTYYNAPNAESLRTHYEHLPTRLRRQNINLNIPWLYDFKLDFRFR